MGIIKRNIFKVARVVLGIMVVPMLFTACSSNNTKTTSVTTESSGKEKKKLKLMGTMDASTWDLREQQTMYQKFMKLFEEANLELEFEGIAQEQYQQVLQTRTAAALDLPDLINLATMTNETILSLGSSGILQDVLAISEQYPSENLKRVEEEVFPNFWGLTVTEDRKSYCMPIWYRLTANENKDEFSSIFLPLLRADWMEKLGLEQPKTADEFIAVLEQMQERDANGNNKKDEKLLYSPAASSSFFEGLGPLFGIPAQHITVDITDHTAKSPWLMKEKLVPYIEFLRTLVDKNLLDVDALDKPNEYKMKKIQSNMISAQVGYAITDFYNVDVDAYDGRYEGVFITGTEGETYIHSELPSLLLGKIGVTKEAKDLDAVMRYFDVFFSEEAMELSKWGLEGIHYGVSPEGLKYPMPPTTKTGLEIAQEGNSHSGIYGGITGIPNRGAWDNMRLEYILVNPKPALVDLGDNHGTGDHKYYYNDYQLAMTSAEELEVVSKIQTDLYTYMNETLMKLVLGQYQVEDLDQYIAKMKELGLEEMLSIYQARHNRYLGK